MIGLDQRCPLLEQLQGVCVITEETAERGKLFACPRHCHGHKDGFRLRIVDIQRVVPVGVADAGIPCAPASFIIYCIARFRCS